MEKRNLQKLRAGYVISLLKQQIFAIFCEDLQIKHRGYVYFESVSPNVISQALNYLKTHNTFYEDILISEGFLSKDMINFSDFDENSDVAESIRKRVISYETEYGSVED